jgi:hypothetical protein
MSLRFRVLLSMVTLGCASAPAKPAPPKPTAAASQPAAIPDGVRVEALPEVVGAAPASWAFITTDLQRLGHPELVLIVQRLPSEGDGAFPADGPDLVSSLAAEVKKGRRLVEWEMAGTPEGMFGRRDLSGIVFGGEVPDPRVKVGAPTMTILLVTQDELEVAMHFGAPRVANLLGRRAQVFPYPPWVDRSRTSVCAPGPMKASPIGKVLPRVWIRAPRPRRSCARSRTESR